MVMNGTGWVTSPFHQIASWPDFLSLFHEKSYSIFPLIQKAVSLDWANSRKSSQLSRKDWKALFNLGFAEPIHAPNISQMSTLFLNSFPRSLQLLAPIGKVNLVLLFPRDKEAESYPCVTLNSGQKFKASDRL